MPAAVPDGLPDPAVLRHAAELVVQAAPAGWTVVDYTMWYEEEDVFGSAMLVTSQGGAPVRVAPPAADLELDDLRTAQIDAGQQPWLRCDLKLRRSDTGSMDDVDMSMDFSYEVGVVPE